MAVTLVRKKPAPRRGAGNVRPIPLNRQPPRCHRRSNSAIEKTPPDGNRLVAARGRELGCRQLHSLDMDPDRARRIEEVWRQQGQKLWDPMTHGNGRPLRVGECEFHLEERDVGGRMKACVVCEDVIVERAPILGSQRNADG
jgi:hypothetical protein